MTHPLPVGVYDRLLDSHLAEQLASRSGVRTEEENDSDSLRERLLDLIRNELQEMQESGNLDHENLPELFNGLLGHLRSTARIQNPAKILTGLGTSASLPLTGLRRNWLFTAGKENPTILSELRTELTSADRVDILVSFITWSGVRKLQDLLEQMTAVGADGQPRLRLRVLTTTYTGATERRALDFLANLPGVELKISLDGRRTRLHAKAWILHRQSGFGSAYVGSANLSGAALTGGLEWTVKFTQNGDRPLFDRAEAHFETLWNDGEFQPYDPNDPEQVVTLDRALARESGEDVARSALPFYSLEPKAYQIELLDRLAAERRHGRMRNLLVAATGTGKTVIAALDYRRTCEREGGKPRLLFVAHRVEILHQARATFAAALHDPDFGEILAGDNQPARHDHLFATIQSLNSRNLAATCGADYWHTIILDECHHAEAAGYDAFLAQVRPKILLGLTATPERGDGQNILSRFDCRPDGGPSAELRLWDALDQQLLAPFEYYGCTDETDLGAVPWDKPGERAALDGLLTGNHARARTVLNAVHRLTTNPHRMRALGFCVSVAHAEFMADQFRKAGIPAESLCGETPADVRRQAPARLARREVNVLFTCDLYNEGIDIPCVDTLLFLRPTQSKVVFQQQLGRGLRLSDGKAACLVVDLVGRHRQEFRFDRLLGVLSGLPRAQLTEAVENGFTSLPPGCHIQLDRMSRERVLENLKATTSTRWTSIARELASYAALPGRARPTLAAFVRDQGLQLEDLYPPRGQQASGWTALKRQAGLLRNEPSAMEIALARRLSHLLHLNDPMRIGALRRLIGGESMTVQDERRLNMLAVQLFPLPSDPRTGSELASILGAEADVRAELSDIATWLDDSCDLPDVPLPGVPSSWSLQLHGEYTTFELLQATGHCAPGNRIPHQAGVLPIPGEHVELLLVTLNKREGFLPRLAFHDYAISPALFHWQTQNSCGPNTGAGRRYLGQTEKTWTFQLMVRECKKDPYVALGPVRLKSVEGDRPMSLTWELERPMSPALFRRFSVL